MPTISIQEKAISSVQIVLSTINKKYFTINYTIAYNYNPNDTTYTGLENIKVCIPIDAISATLTQSMDTATELSCSLVIKNNEDTVIHWNNNDYSIDLTGPFGFTTLQVYYDSIYSASFV